MRVLVILGGKRYQKTAETLPHSGLEYLTIQADRVGWWLHPPPILHLPLLLPEKLWLAARVGTRRQVRRLTQSYQPDLVYASSGLAARACLGAIADLGLPTVIRLGGHIYDEERDNLAGRDSRSPLRKLVLQKRYQIIYKALREASHVTTVSNEMADRLAVESGRSRDSISAITVPCHIERFNLPKSGDSSKFRVLTVTNLMFRPKLQAILDFLPALDQFHVKLIAPGRHHKELAEKVSRSSSFDVQGFVPDIEKEYQKAMVLCYFSYLDGCPNVVLEAWASRTPVVANDCAWSRELIQHGETGLLAKSPSEAKTHVKALLDSPPLRETLAESGFKYVCEHHSVQSAGTRLGEVLKKALAQAREA